MPHRLRPIALATRTQLEYDPAPTLAGGHVAATGCRAIQVALGVENHPGIRLQSIANLLEKQMQYLVGPFVAASPFQFKGYAAPQAAAPIRAAIHCCPIQISCFVRNQGTDGSPAVAALEVMQYGLTPSAVGATLQLEDHAVTARSAVHGCAVQRTALSDHNAPAAPAVSAMEGIENLLRRRPARRARRDEQYSPYQHTPDAL